MARHNWRTALDLVPSLKSKGYGCRATPTFQLDALYVGWLETNQVDSRHVDLGRTTFFNILANFFTSKFLSSSRSASSLAACFSLNGFFGFERFIPLELYAPKGMSASCCRTS